MSPDPPSSRLALCLLGRMPRVLFKQPQVTEVDVMSNHDLPFLDLWLSRRRCKQGQNQEGCCVMDHSSHEQCVHLSINAAV